MPALPASIPSVSRRASAPPLSSSVIARPATATDGAALKSPAKRFGDRHCESSAKATTSRPPARPLSSRISSWCTTPLRRAAVQRRSGAVRLQAPGQGERLLQGAEVDLHPVAPRSTRADIDLGPQRGPELVGETRDRSELVGVKRRAVLAATGRPGRARAGV